MPQFERDLVIFAATETNSVGGSYPEYYSRAVDAFPAAELVSVEGADHFFQGEAGDEMMADALAFIESHFFE